MITLERITEEIESCIFPVSIEEKSNLVRKLVTYSKRSRAVIGMIIAKARRDNFINDMTGWKAWCKNNTGAVDAGRTHLNQIGSLLLDQHQLLDRKIYQILLGLDTNKLLAIYRLHSSQVDDFIKAYHPEKNNVETVRHHVAFCLKEVDSPDLPEQNKSKNKPEGSKWQPSLWDAIDIMSGSEADHLDRLYMADEFSPTSCYKTGMVLVDNVINYFDSHNASTNALLTAEQQLRSMADKLGTIRERQSESITKELEAS